MQTRVVSKFRAADRILELRVTDDIKVGLQSCALAKRSFIGS